MTGGRVPSFGTLELRRRGISLSSLPLPFGVVSGVSPPITKPVRFVLYHSVFLADADNLVPPFCLRALHIS